MCLLLIFVFENSLGDLKPENLLFTNTSDSAILKLTDFGFAKEGLKQIERKTLTNKTHLYFLSLGNNEQRPLNTPW